MLGSNFSRRRFLGTAAGAGIGVATAASIGPLASPASAAMGVAAPDVPRSEVGTQLFNFAYYWFTGGKWGPLFEELAAQGYTSVEFFGVYGEYGETTTDATIVAMRKLLDDNGLKAIGSHLSLDS